MKTTPGINRRQWLRTAGLTLAGIFVAPRFVRGTGGVAVAPVQPEVAVGSTELPAKAAQSREYLHGFESYPA